MTINREKYSQVFRKLSRHALSNGWVVLVNNSTCRLINRTGGNLTFISNNNKLC